LKWSIFGALLTISLSGTFKTPQLLELSGIGDRSLLKSFGIEPLVDLPGVGENLLDQTYTLIDYVAKKHVKTLGTYLPLLINQTSSHSHP
jgi:choline dehydrogenase-like flavoprotein